MTRSRSWPFLLLCWLTGCPGGRGQPITDLAPHGEGGSTDGALPDTHHPDRGESEGGAPADGGPGPFAYLQLNHLLCTGQSLSLGAQGAPALSTTPPYDNRMFNTGVNAGGTGLSSLVPLVEKNVETMSSGLANLVTRLAREEVFSTRPPPENSHDLLVSCHGKGGTEYAGLKKGTVPYQNGLAQIAAGVAISKALGLSYGVRAVTVVHGERDTSLNTAGYDQNLAEWQRDYEQDVQQLTGRQDPVPLLQTQVSSWTRYNRATSPIPGAQLKAAIDNPGRVVLVGPKYFLPYTDGVHLTNHGYRQLGEYYAKVYRQVILEQRPWEPLRPRSVTLSGAVIRIVFHVPVPPLVFDGSLVSNPGHKGFEYDDDSASPPTITAVALDGPDAVKVTLSAAPTGGQRRIRYAWTGTVGANAGPTTGPRGTLRDSDATVSRSSYPLYNWCVHFARAVP